MSVCVRALISRLSFDILQTPGDNEHVGKLCPKPFHRVVIRLWDAKVAYLLSFDFNFPVRVVVARTNGQPLHPLRILQTSARRLFRLVGSLEALT